MANKRFSELNSGNQLALNDILPILDKSDTTQAITGSVKGYELATLIAFMREYLDSAVENSYTLVSAMIADQANQTSGFIQFVADASADPNITSGYAYYEYLGTVNGDLTDYRLLSASEVAVIESLISYRTFKVKEKTTSATVSTDQQKLSIIYTGADITEIVFDQSFSSYVRGIEEALVDYEIILKLVNHSTKAIFVVKVSAVDWTDLNGDYKGVEVVAGLNPANFSVDDEIEVLFDISNVRAIDGGTV